MKLPGRPTLARLQGPFEASILNLRTWENYAKCLDLLVEYYGPDKEPQHITRDSVKHYRAWLSEKKGFSEERIRKTISPASSFFAWMFLMEVEGVFVNPFRSLSNGLGGHPLLYNLGKTRTGDPITK